MRHRSIEVSVPSVYSTSRPNFNRSHHGRPWDFFFREGQGPGLGDMAIRKRNFLNKFCVTNNELCKIFTDRAKKELTTLLADYC